MLIRPTVWAGFYFVFCLVALGRVCISRKKKHVHGLNHFGPRARFCKPDNSSACEPMSCPHFRHDGLAIFLHGRQKRQKQYKE